MSRDLTFVLLAVACALLIVLIISFASRARVFSQYLHLLTGIRITSREVRHVFARRGRAGVRELFLDLLIREDLAEEGVANPDAEPHRPVALELDEERERTASGIHVVPEEEERKKQDEEKQEEENRDEEERRREEPGP